MISKSRALVLVFLFVGNLSAYNGWAGGDFNKLKIGTEVTVAGLGALGAYGICKAVRHLQHCGRLYGTASTGLRAVVCFVGAVNLNQSVAKALIGKK